MNETQKKERKTYQYGPNDFVWARFRRRSPTEPVVVVVVAVAVVEVEVEVGGKVSHAVRVRVTETER